MLATRPKAMSKLATGIRAVAFRMPKPTPAVDGNSTREMPSPEPGYTSRACMSLRITPARKR
jgi:hypothetical protein